MQRDPRKAPLPARLAQVRTLTAEARATAAAQVFALGTVIVTISEAASQGLNMVVLAPGRPLDLRAEKVTEATVKALLADGFDIEWEQRPGPRPDQPGWAMIIRW